jgi:type VI secretion system secreted protein VgrG
MFSLPTKPLLSLISRLNHDLQVLEFTGKEAISQPFRFDLKLVSESPDTGSGKPSASHGVPWL